MGYYVSLTNVNAVIPKDNLLNAYRRLCALNERNDLKRGGSFYAGAEKPLRGAHKDVWFSLMDWNYPDVYDDAEGILRAVGFDLYINDDGDLVFTGYDEKTGCEDVFVDAIAQYLVSDDELPVQFVWTGEDQRIWRQVKYIDSLVYEEGRIVFGSDLLVSS